MRYHFLLLSCQKWQLIVVPNWVFACCALCFTWDCLLLDTECQGKHWTCITLSYIFPSSKQCQCLQTLFVLPQEYHHLPNHVVLWWHTPVVYLSTKLAAGRQIRSTITLCTLACLHSTNISAQSAHTDFRLADQVWWKLVNIMLACYFGGIFAFW